MKYPTASKFIILISIWFLGVAGTGFAQLRGGDILVVDIAAGADGAGALFSVDPASGIRTMISNFGLSTQGPVGSFPVGVAIESSGNILVSTYSRLLFRVDPVTGMRTVLSNFSNSAQGPVGLGPGGVTLDSAGNILVADKLTNVLFRVDPVDGMRTIVSTFTDATQGPVGKDPFGDTVDQSGMILVTDQAFNSSGRGALFRVDPTTGARTLVSDFGDASKGPLGAEPNGLEVEASGNVIVADLGAGAGSTFNNIGVLFRIDPVTGNRAILTDFSNAAGGTLGHSPVGVALDQNGQVLVTTMNGASSAPFGRLVRVDPATGFRTLLSDFGDASQGPLGQDPFDLTIVPLEELEELEVQTASVEIEIKPGGDTNPINRRSNGVVPVALFGSAEFDTGTVDWQTVSFAGASPVKIHPAQSVNSDGFPDVVFHFSTQSLDLPAGTSEACLTGMTTSGVSFSGCDSIKLK